MDMLIWVGVIFLLWVFDRAILDVQDKICDRIKRAWKKHKGANKTRILDMYEPINPKLKRAR